ncbi:MAG: aminopeptidase [Lachnospiraceae bacterium]|nr:aminopeptidase [Lachnospiraceae bacterium]
MRDIDKMEEMINEYDERYQLMLDRVTDISQENILPEPYGRYFAEVATFIRDVMEVYEQASQRLLVNDCDNKCKKYHDKFFGRLMTENYEDSFLNPTYSVSVMGKDMGQIMSALYADIMSLISAAYEQRMDYICVWSELFVQVYGCFLQELEEKETLEEEDFQWIYKNVKDAMYWFYHDYTEIFVADNVRAYIDTEYDFMYDMIMFSDLSNNNYLYRYGLPIGVNETGIADYLRKLPQEEIDAMAATYTNGYRKGFEVTGRDLSKKKTVKIEAPVGFERVVRAAIKQFKEMGLHATFNREPSSSITGRGSKRGIYSTSVNPQFDYDHKDDKAIYFDKSYVERRLEVLKDVYEKNKDKAAVYGGPAVIEVFGQVPFSPKSKAENIAFTDKQNSLSVYFASEGGQIVNQYIPGEEYSFTIIAYPLPEIGDKFEEIFAKTVEINNLDYELYEKVQAKIIDVLDQGEYAHVTGRNGNHTDIYVHLHELPNPDEQTIFENCVADVNIPVGEVFTSPVLEGTRGVLHVKQVYLMEYNYKDLEFVFEDGCVKSYSCANFESEEENKKYIFDNILHKHETLPIGEFAIGTNTIAYKMGRDFEIQDKLPILIAEKTGPHFAVGDTCYSHAEDVAVYNQNGKEIIARENTFSLKRHEDMSQAYFNCHTDITIPYDELGDITVLTADGRELPIIKDGRFVVPGTEVLNEVLD